MLILAGGVLSAADLAKLPAVEQAAYHAKEASSVQGPYLVLALALLALAVLFAFARLPKIVDAEQPGGESAGWSAVLKHRHLVLGAVAIFLYVGGEVSIGSFLINFMGDPKVMGLAAADAAPFVSYYWGGAMIGRFIGFAVMRSVSPGKALAFNSAAVIVLVLVAIFSGGHLAMWSILAVGLFNSIMFPTIFSMALNKLGPLTGQGSGVLCMAIVGGALVPFAQGLLADNISLQLSFLVPAACYTFILYFGLKYANMYSEK
jgi:FHS family L-fucose permease-like MFS transporter